MIETNTLTVKTQFNRWLGANKRVLTLYALGAFIGLITLKVSSIAYRFLKPKQGNCSNHSTGANEGTLTVQPTVEPSPQVTVAEPLADNNGLYKKAVTEPLTTVETTVDELYTDEDIEREMMCRTMSLLGKRSAEARRLRKLNAG